VGGGGREGGGLGAGWERLFAKRVLVIGGLGGYKDRVVEVRESHG